MKDSRTRLGVLSATIAILVLPAAAQAEYLVPPDNSAVNQYTETYPTAGGNKDSEKTAAGKQKTPAEVLGSRNARRLEAQGEQGRAVAEVAAETAPSTEVVTETETPAAAPANGDGRSRNDESSRAGDDGRKGDDRDAGENAAAARPDNSGGSGSDGPSGSSGLGEVIAQATGSSSTGGTGLLLPLLIVGGIAWSVAYLVRQRKKPAA